MDTNQTGGLGGLLSFDTNVKFDTATVVEFVVVLVLAGLVLGLAVRLAGK